MPGMRMSRRMQPASRSGAIFQDFAATLICPHLEAAGLEREADRAAHRFIVVDNMNETRFLTAHFFASPLGTVKWKAVPPVVRGSNQMRPPCASMIVRQIERPIPMPFCFDVMNG